LEWQCRPISVSFTPALATLAGFVVRTAVALRAVIEILDAFLDVFAGHICLGVLVAAVAGVFLVVVVAILLAARQPMHRFARDVPTQSELRSGLIFAAATLVVWPVIPVGYFGPFDSVNPRSIWTVVILIMAISACGYVAVRALGRPGLPVTV
jgi:uncharacterized membrane protein (DUF4010 family)